ncbi:MAG: zinc-dependent metalloprotease [Actinobacteria bacterium]|nr:zinc-dependent metalloprotease [Actinomycetota bacterium]
MSGNFPFGFQPPDDDPDRKNNPLGDFDMSQLGSMLENLGRMMQSGGGDGSVNWDMANQVARSTQPQKDDNGVSSPERSAVDDATRLANLWLGESESFPATSTESHSWSRGEWVAGTLPAWKQIITPVADQVQSTMGTMMTGQGLPTEGLPPELDMGQLSEMLGPLTGMAKQMGSAMFGSQVGQGLGTLSGEVLCSSDIGIPLTEDGVPTIVPRNVNEFADGIDIPRQDVLLFIALRECAHQRLYTHVPWLRARLEESVDAYARGISLDTSAIEEAVSNVDPSNPESLQEVLGGGVFELSDSPEQKAALARLETLLALIEGWVDFVVDEAASDKLPKLAQLNEAMRRRRAAGGPAEKTFAQLVGLELRPRRLREATQFWREITDKRGLEGRDAVWEHPDLLPSADDLDDLSQFWAREAAVADFAAQLDAGAIAASIESEDSSDGQDSGTAEETDGDEPDKGSGDS